MASKRMIKKSIVEQDKFLDMKPQSKCLYFYLILHSDDDGFVGNVKGIMRSIFCEEEDMDVLKKNKYVVRLASGVYWLPDFLIHNPIRKDRYIPTIFSKEKDIIEKMIRSGEIQSKN